MRNAQDRLPQAGEAACAVGGRIELDRPFAGDRERRGNALPHLDDAEKTKNGQAHQQQVGRRQIVLNEFDDLTIVPLPRLGGNSWELGVG